MSPDTTVSPRWRQGAAACAPLAREALGLVRELYPLCRSITGDAVRRTLDRLGQVAALRRTEVPSGTAVFDWEIPREWNARQAWIRGPDGRKVVDLAEHNLHLVSYSIPFRGVLPLAELQQHLHSLPDHPDWIPYRTSYYREQWGFCLRHQDRQALVPGDYEVCVDTTLEPGSLSYAEAIIAGESDREILVYTHTCHPSLANDNLSGMAAAAIIARELGRQRRRHSIRFVFGPGTIGSLAWLGANEAHLERIGGGLVVGLLGDPGSVTYKLSRRGDATVDRAARLLLPQIAPGARVVPFEPYGYDERQFCSSGFNLPVGRLTRSPNGSYPEYHSSADNPDLITIESLAESIYAVLRLLDALASNSTFVNLLPKGEPQLGKRGLYGSIGGQAPGVLVNAMLWVLNQSDGSNDLLAIAQRSGADFDMIAAAARALEDAGLLRELTPALRPAGSGA